MEKGGTEEGGEDQMHKCKLAKQKTKKKKREAAENGNNIFK